MQNTRIGGLFELPIQIRGTWLHNVKERSLNLFIFSPFAQAVDRLALNSVGVERRDHQFLSPYPQCTMDFAGEFEPFVIEPVVNLNADNDLRRALGYNTVKN
jgi:hypothetical protein